ADVVEDAIRYATSGDVAAIIVEPVMGEGGIIPLPPGYLRRVREILDRYGILLVIDEVQSGLDAPGCCSPSRDTGSSPTSWPWPRAWRADSRWVPSSRARTSPMRSSPVST